MSDRVAITVSSHVAHMTLTRADKMNALDPAMFEAICGAIDELSAMPDLRAARLRMDDTDVGAGNDIQPAPDRDPMGRCNHRHGQRSPTPSDLLRHVGESMSPGHQIHGLGVATKV